ncbi:MAG: lipopolysaccharide biosynthesis protein, partial [Flavobacteriales bacterium]
MVWFSIIVGLDAIVTVPLARLRLENKAFNFAFVNLANVFIFIGLNLFYIVYCKTNYEAGQNNFIIENLYDPHTGVGYVFIANLIASTAKFSLLLPIITKMRFNLDITLLKKMLFYAFPLLISGVGIIINETMDKMMLKPLLMENMEKQQALAQVGIYGACYKLSIIIMLFVQAFRYAADPFFFSQEQNSESSKLFSKVMTFFVAICSIIFTGVMLYIDIIKYFIRKEVFWQGLEVVPILMMAKIFLGIFYNLSIWYKLTEKTKYGAIITSIGAIITIVMNLILIPRFGYLGSAWATFMCYGSMMLISYFLGRRFYKINYEIKKIFFYLGTAIGIYFLSTIWQDIEPLLKYSVNTFLMILFVIGIFFIEKPMAVV